MARNHKLEIKLNRQEKVELFDLAKKQDVSVSEYVRSRVFGNGYQDTVALRNDIIRGLKKSLASSF
ncbi:MAG: hypothetical protein DRN71_04855 [Candidatus Nanohalarchaeota archaeon]|nr:MAG: hypothetical protein DRN71_04855 [Candidatus Nanohaloarchaeota archaeon]